MANTGKKIVLTLEEMIPPYPPPNPTGNTKPNVEGDPDYIEPYIDLVDCPVTTDLTCPGFLATGGVGQVEVEFSILNSVLQNPSVAKFKIRIMDSGGTVEQASEVYTFPITPEPSYVYDTIPGVPAGTHVIHGQYLDAADVVQADCNNLATGIVTT